MQVYKTPIREYRFLLEDFLKLNSSKVLTDRSLEIDDLLMIIEEASCLLYTSPSPRDRQKYRMPSSA